MQISVQIKSVYGENRIYPACEKAEVFCQMLRQKTLTHRDVERIKKLGFEVNVLPVHPAKL